MPLTILASVSLLALVVTGRPLLAQDTPQLVQTTGEVQNAVQAILESRIGSGFLKSDGKNDDDKVTIDSGIQVRLASSASQSAYLSQLSSEDVKLIVPLDDKTLSPSNDEQILYNALNGLNELDGGTRPLEEVLSEYDGETNSEEEDDNLSVLPGQNHVHPLLFTFALSAVFMFIVVCVGVTLYVLEFSRKNVLSNRLIWRLLPHLETGSLQDSKGGNVGFKEKLMVLGGPAEAIDEKVEMNRTMSKESLFEDASSNVGDDEEDDFEDASETSHHPDPDLLPLPLSSENTTPSQSPRRRPLQMRELPPNPPSWSVQATVSPSPYILPGAYPYEPEPMPLPDVVGRRAFREPTSEIDIALALQMRPGFGPGADAAWLVRFIMGMFGWLSVFVVGGNR